MCSLKFFYFIIYLTVSLNFCSGYPSPLVGTEARLSRLEQCDCQKSCYSNGTVHADGATWQRDCNRCSCVHGEIICRPVECARAECKNPVILQGECCPTCLKQCLLKGTLFEHGDRFTPKGCQECICQDGYMLCQKVMDPETDCPRLQCDPSDQFTVPGECCKFCPGVDYCITGHSCDENATCMSLNYKYTCKCNQGYQGDGYTCQDVDECQEEGGLHGHHCHSNTRCVNMAGGYMCQCLDGYDRRDTFNCYEKPGVSKVEIKNYIYEDNATFNNNAIVNVNQTIYQWVQKYTSKNENTIGNATRAEILQDNDSNSSNESPTSSSDESSRLSCDRSSTPSSNESSRPSSNESPYHDD